MSSVIEFAIDGPNEETYRHIEENSENMRQAIRQTFFFLGRDLKKKTSDSIISKSGKTGRIYITRTKSGARRRHRSSAPGETHANFSGKLRKSIGWKVHGTNSLEFGYGVTKWFKDKDDQTSEDYARRIELGGTDKRGVTIEARPSLKNNIEGVSFETFYEKALEKIAGI